VKPGPIGIRIEVKDLASRQIKRVRRSLRRLGGLRPLPPFPPLAALLAAAELERGAA
jgi:hypothetical protein